MNFPYGRHPPLIMGILNLTPDSFSDGGRWVDPTDAVKYAIEMVEQGADILDIGAESTRPGHSPVSAEEEWGRLEPVLKELIPSVDVPVSIDTMKADVAERCIALDVDIINDVNGLRGERMIEVCAGSDVDVVISHMNGMPGDTHKREMGPDYRQQIKSFLDSQCELARSAGIKDNRIILDPGVGFGKTPEQNLEISKDCSFLGKDHPILLGVSRKRFIRQYYPDMDVDAATAVVSKGSGAHILRVHNVKTMINELRP